MSINLAATTLEKFLAKFASFWPVFSTRFATQMKLDEFYEFFFLCYLCMCVVGEGRVVVICVGGSVGVLMRVV